MSDAPQTTKLGSETRQLVVGAASATCEGELFNTVSAYLPRFYRIAMGRLKNMADAEDAVQDALLRAWKNRGQFKGQAHVSTWITAILINSVRMTFRKNGRHRNVSLNHQDSYEDAHTISNAFLDSRPNPEELCQRWDLEKRAISLSRALNPRLRAAFELRDLQGLTIEETAQLLGIGQNAVKARAWRARAALKKVLDRRIGRVNKRL